MDKNKKGLIKIYTVGDQYHKTIQDIKKIINENLDGNYDLEIIDIAQNPEEIEEENIMATPTIIKKFPLPEKKIIGEVHKVETVLYGLEIE